MSLRSILRSFLKRRRRTRQVGRRAYERFREDARIVIGARVAYWRSVQPFTIGRISIKNHQRLWGSCSSRGNLNFNWRLLCLPQHLADYVVVHELCHIREMNHSRQFWAHVESLLPEWRTHRAELRRYAPTFFNAHYSAYTTQQRKEFLPDVVPQSVLTLLTSTTHET